MVKFLDLPNGSYVVKAQVGGRRTSTSAALVIDLEAQQAILAPDTTGLEVTNEFPAGTYLTLYKDGSTEPMRDSQL